MESRSLTVIVASAATCALFAASLMGCSSEKPSSNDAQNAAIEQSAEQPVKKQEIYYAGVYEVGVDIPAGNYILTPDENDTTNTLGAYIGVFPDESLDVNKILYYNYFKDSYRVTVTDGQFVKVSNASFEPAE